MKSHDLVVSQGSGSLLFFDVQGSDKGGAEDVAFADQVSAFLALFSSLQIFFFEGHVEASKVHFLDRVAHTAKLLRNDSTFVPPTDFVLRRPLRLPSRFADRESEFETALGDGLFKKGRNRVFELPELPNMLNSHDADVAEYSA